jgi:hypothetical protein
LVFVPNAGVVEAVDVPGTVAVEVPIVAGRLGPVFVMLADKPAGVPVPAKDRELLIADGLAGVVLVPPFAREKVLLIVDEPAAVADVPPAPAFDKENEGVMAVWPRVVAMFAVPPRVELPGAEDTFVRAFEVVASVVLAASAASTVLVWFPAECAVDGLVLLAWEFCKALASLCSLVAVFVPLAVECLGV